MKTSSEATWHVRHNVLPPAHALLDVSGHVHGPCHERTHPGEHGLVICIQFDAIEMRRLKRNRTAEYNTRGNQKTYFQNSWVRN